MNIFAIKTYILLFLGIGLVLGKINTYKVKEKTSNNFCFGIEFDGQIDVAYEKVTGGTGIFKFNIDEVVSTTGSCDESSNVLSVLIRPIKDNKQLWSFKLTFATAKKNYKMAKIEILGKLDSSMVSDIKESVDIDLTQDVDLYEAKDDSIAVCYTPKVIPVNKELNFVMRSVRVEAFVDKKDIDFSGPIQQCIDDYTSTLYVYDKQTNKYCLEMRANFTLDIKYNSTDGSVKTLKLPFPHEYLVDKMNGHCINNHSNVNFSFRPFNDSQIDFWNVVVDYFLRDKFISLDEISINGPLRRSFLPDLKEDFDFFDKFIINNVFTSIQENIMSCKSVTKLVGGQGSTLEVKDLEAKSFVQLDKIEFSGNVDSCAADSVTKSVLMPVIIGVTISAMVLIALIIFVVFMKKRQTV